MLRFHSISMRNFLSYGNQVTTVELGKPGTTAIVGEDLDNVTNGSAANGVGKTVTINALAYALYDKTVSKIKTKDLLINNVNKQDMFVTVVFSVKDDLYEVTRARKVKGGGTMESGNWVKVIKNGENVTPDSTNNTNTYIEGVIGMPYELFVRIVVFSATNTPFLDLPSATAVNVIEELFGLTTISDRAAELKDVIKETQFKCDNVQIRIDAAEGELTRHTTQLENARQRVLTWQTKNDADVLRLEAELTENVDFDVDIEAEQALQSEIADTESLVKTLASEQGVLAKEHRTLASKISKVESEIYSLKEAKCPYCSQEYHDTKAKIEEKESELAGYESSTEEIEEALVALNDEQGAADKRLVSMKSNVKVANLTQLIKSRSDVDTKKQMLENMKVAGNPFVEPLEEIEAVELPDVSYDELNEFKKQIDHQKFLLKLLTRKDSFVRKSLLNKRLPFLNQRLQEYLKLLGLPHKVEFTTSLTASITSFGRKLEFGNLSNGQSKRVNIALSFAFRDVLQKTHTKINVWMLDEVLDAGLDGVGVTSAAKLLRDKSKEDDTSVFIISHRDEIDGAFDRKLTVQLDKGFSYIVQD